MESHLYIKLCGPRKYGCYGCENLDFNSKIVLSDEAAKIAGQKYILPDLSSKAKKIAIEYNSAKFHENIERGQKDQRRRDALVYDG